jgi:hypothetical protein
MKLKVYTTRRWLGSVVIHHSGGFGWLYGNEAMQTYANKTPLNISYRRRMTALPCYAGI